jgi:glycosyltransferase involved in cell wall biosynthesis
MLYEDVNGWRIHRTPRHLFYYYEYNLLFLPCLFRLWRKPGFDLLRIHSPTFSLAAALFKGVTGVPTIAHHHHLEARRIHRWLTGLMVSASDRVITVSDFSRRQLLSTYGLPPEKVVVVSNGVTVEYNPRTGKPHIPLAGSDGKRVFYLGSLKPRKNLLFLLDVFAKVHSEEPGALLIIGGGGEQETQLKDRAAELGLSKEVVFPGHIPEDEKVAYYSLADVFVLPSLLEGFGMVAAEAMACGTPVVASSACSLPEVVVDGKTGLLADPRDVDDFAEKILRLLSSGDLREQMGQAGREWVLSNFSWNAAAAKTKAVYEDVLQTR